MNQPVSGGLTVGVVGLGVMGGPIARRLLDAGRTVAVYDIRPDAVADLAAAGAVACESVRAVADAAETIIMSLPAPAIVQSAAAEAVEGTSVRLLIDVSTSGAMVARQNADAAAARSIGYIDAPVSGGPAGAREGRLSAMVAGAPEALEQARPVLDLLTTAIIEVGDEAGQGQLTKVLNNLMSATSILITSEAYVLATKAGLDPERFLAAVNASSGRNTASSDKFPRHVVPRTFDFGFRMQLMVKDTKLCLDEARQAGSAMPLGGLVQQLWAIADASLDEGADATEMVKLVEAWSGVQGGSDSGTR